MSKLGQPDLGLATLNDMRANAEMIANLDPTVPLIADADAGYGGPIMVGRTVTQYAKAGVAALHIEDQVQSKRCGHLLGKQLVDVETFTSRISAAVLARSRIVEDIVIIARTDAFASEGFDDAISRLKAAISVGADVAFLEGVTSKEQAEAAVFALAPTPVLLNLPANGMTPNFTITEAREMGFKIAIFPTAALGPAALAMKSSYEVLKKTGTDAIANKGMSPKSMFVDMGMNDLVAFDQEAGGRAYGQV